MLLLQWLLVIVGMEIVRRMAVFEYRQRQHIRDDIERQDATALLETAALPPTQPLPDRSMRRWLLALAAASTIAIAFAMHGHVDPTDGAARALDVTTAGVQRIHEVGQAAGTRLRELAGNSSTNTYTVAPGDTCWGIARRKGLDLAELQRANGLSDEACRTMRPGEKLVLPQPAPLQ